MYLQVFYLVKDLNPGYRKSFYNSIQRYSNFKWAKDINSDFTKDVQNKNMKRYSVSLIIKVNTIETTMGDHIHC